MAPEWALLGWRGRLVGMMLLGLTALAGQDPDAEFLARFQAKLAASYTVGSGQTAGNEVLLLSPLGMALTPDWLSDKRGLSSLLDQIPIVANAFSSSGLTVSNTYTWILESAQASTYLDMKKRDAYDKAMELLYDRTGQPKLKLTEYRANLKKYLGYQCILQSAQEEQSIAAAEAATEGIPVPPSPSLDKTIQDASSNMALVKSLMGEVEAAFKTIADYDEDHAEAWLLGLKNNNAAAQVDPGLPEMWFPDLVISPDADTWLSDADWKSISYKQSEHPMPAVPLPVAQAPKGAAPRTPAPPGWLATLSLTMQTKRIRISRPWLDPSLFTSQQWLLPSWCGIGVVATGNLTDPNPGVMPMVITGLLLSRNLSIKGQWAAGNDSSPAALGPFNLAKAQSTSTQANGLMSINCAGPQIIGYFCTVLPKTPNPGKNFRPVIPRQK